METKKKQKKRVLSLVAFFFTSSQQCSFSGLALSPRRIINSETENILRSSRVNRRRKKPSMQTTIGMPKNTQTPCEKNKNVPSLTHNSISNGPSLMSSRCARPCLRHSVVEQSIVLCFVHHFQTSVSVCLPLCVCVRRSQTIRNGYQLQRFRIM